MPKGQKSRDHIEYDGQASSRLRNDVQMEAAANNKAHPRSAPWRKSKARRLARRITAGKTYENWAKSSAGRESIANAKDSATTRK